MNTETTKSESLTRAATHPATFCWSGESDHYYASGWELDSPNGAYKVVLQNSDGNLVIYRGSTALWSSHTNGYPDTLRFLSNGQIQITVPVEGGYEVLWHGGTSTSAPRRVEMQNDGNFVEYNGGCASGSGVAVWATGT